MTTYTMQPSMSLTTAAAERPHAEPTEYHVPFMQRLGAGKVVLALIAIALLAAPMVTRRARFGAWVHKVHGIELPAEAELLDRGARVPILMVWGGAHYSATSTLAVADASVSKLFSQIRVETSRPADQNMGGELEQMRAPDGTIRRAFPGCSGAAQLDHVVEGHSASGEAVSVSVWQHPSEAGTRIVQFASMRQG